MKAFHLLPTLSVLSLSLFALTACDTQKPTETANQTEQTAKTSNEQNNNNKATTNYAGKTLTVYSYDSFTSDWGPAPKLKESFEANCNCTIEFVPFEDGVTMFNRVRLEGDNPKADVIIGLDNNLLNSAQASGLFAKTNIDLSHLQLPTKWTNQTFIPYDYGQYAFIYNKEAFAKNGKTPPKSLKELVNNQNYSVIYQDPRTSTVGRGLLAWVNEVFGDQSEAAWKALSKHTVTVGKGWSETYEAFKNGESDLVLSYNTSPLYHKIHEDTDKYVAASFDEGHIVQIELAAQLKASDTPALAQDFIAFLLTPEAQKTIATSNIMLPVINTKIEPNFDAFVAEKTLAVPTPDDKTAKAQIDVWQKAVSK
ncbi:MAG: thiamine ABC transporter substrate binding subunit [Gammaproteobacteria bacterium]|nr:MAG: thiamine ABC transporter substrate binding subunit [Gammaproteobacteria bacterium]